MMEVEDEADLNIDSLRSRTKLQSDILTTINSDSPTESSSQLKNLLQDSNLLTEIKQFGVYNLDSVHPQDLDVGMKDALEQLNLAKAENSRIYDEIKALTSIYMEESIHMERDVEGLNCSLKFLESQGLEKSDVGASVGRSTPLNGSLRNQNEEFNFELLELEHQTVKKKDILSSLEDLDYSLKWVEDFCQIEDILTGLKVIEFDGNGIRCSLETFIPTLENTGCQQNMEFTNNLPTVLHELYIEVYDGTLELKNVEIFPNDVFIGELLHDAKSSWKFFPSMPLEGITSSLQWLIEKVQDRVLLCTLRRLIVKEANTTRHSFEYSDRDGTVIAHMVSGVDAVIKLPTCWPLVNSTLKLISLKRPNNSTKELSLSSWNMEELGSSMDVQTQKNLVSFVDAVEKIIAQRMGS